MEIAGTQLFKRIIRKFEIDIINTDADSDNRLKNRWKPLLKRTGPWAAAVFFLVFLFHSIEFNKFIEALIQVNLTIYLPWLLVFGIAAFLMDVQNLKSVLLQFDYDVPYQKLLHIRGMTYLVMVINYTLGIGSIALYLKRDVGIPLIRSAGLMLVYNSATQNCLAIIAGTGCFFFQDSPNMTDKIFFLCVSIVSVSIAIISTLKLMPESGKILKFKHLEVVKVFHELPWISYILITFWRGVYYLTFLIFYYYAVRAFNMEIPLSALVVYVPVVLLIISLPITPFGLGTSQAAMIFFFKEYGSEATILAFGLTYSTSVILIRGMIGILFLTNIQERLLNIQRG